MPIHDFQCEACGHVHEELVKRDIKSHTCPECGNDSKLVFLKVARLNYLAMGAQKNVSPEFKDRFEKMHKKQTDKENAFEKEHGPGEYFNRAPGS